MIKIAKMIKEIMKNTYKGLIIIWMLFQVIQLMAWLPPPMTMAQQEEIWKQEADQKWWRLREYRINLESELNELKVLNGIYKTKLLDSNFAIMEWYYQKRLELNITNQKNINDVLDNLTDSSYVEYKGRNIVFGAVLFIVVFIFIII